jgi:hypothetical protein
MQTSKAMMFLSSLPLNTGAAWDWLWFGRCGCEVLGHSPAAVTSATTPKLVL